MDFFEVVGCEVFGYDKSMRPTGQVSLTVQHDALGDCLGMHGCLPTITTQAQIVMFLRIRGADVRLFGALLPVVDGVVNGLEADKRIRTDKGQEQALKGDQSL